MSCAVCGVMLSRLCVYLQVDLMETFKRSMSRDFRINHQAVDAILNEGEDEEEGGGKGEGGGEGEGEGEGEEGVEVGEDNGPPTPKKLKL